jgi:hypothetical protein
MIVNRAGLTAKIKKTSARNEAARDDIQRKAERWMYEIKKDGLEKRRWPADALFEEKFDGNVGRTTINAILLVNGQEVARNVFTCQIDTTVLKNQVGAYDPQKKY